MELFRKYRTFVVYSKYKNFGDFEKNAFDI